MYFLFFIVSFLRPATIFAAAVPAVIPDSINTSQLFSGSFDPQYPNKDFVPNDPSGVSCEFKITASQDVGTTKEGDPNYVMINKEITDPSAPLGPRAVADNLYRQDQCADSSNYDQCVSARNNSLDSQNVYGASSPLQRQLSQKVKNQLLCQRWHSGILSGNKVIDTDERVGCYCGGNNYGVNTSNCSGCRDIYFSELAFFNTSFCPLAPDISKFYNCGSGDCLAKKREPKFNGLIPEIVANRLLKEVSIVPKGSIASRVTQKDTGNSTVAAVPFLMSPSSSESTQGLNYALPASFQKNTSDLSCTPVNSTTGPDKVKIDFFAEIKAFFTGEKQVTGDAVIQVDYPKGTTDGVKKVADFNNSLLPAAEQKTHGTIQAHYSVGSPDSPAIPDASVNPLRLNLTPASWQHL